MRLVRLMVLGMAVAAVAGCGSATIRGGSGKGGASGTGGRGGGSGAGGGGAGASGMGGGGGSAGPSGSGGGAGASGSGGSSGAGGGTVCTTVTTTISPVPASMLVLADRSPSMSGSKWTTTSQAIVQGLDRPLFDPLSVGLLAAPNGTITGGACVLGIPIECGSPTAPQVPLGLAGSQKSSATAGVRHDISAWLMANVPDNGQADSMPLYAAIQKSLDVLKASTVAGKRVLVILSDGGIGCTDGTSRPAYPDCNGCNLWEIPDNIVTLVSGANGDAQKPIDTFVIGLPGSDSYDATACTDAPYHMQLALSAIAYAGSPANADATCTGKTFTKTGAAPTVPCHVDLTTGFSAQAVADAISSIRQKAVGCVYDLPQNDGGTVDTGKVNVQIDTGSGTATSLLKRSNAGDACASGCWDYDQSGRIAVLGGACAMLSTATSPRVSAVVGCPTMVKP